MEICGRAGVGEGWAAGVGVVALCFPAEFAVAMGSGVLSHPAAIAMKTPLMTKHNSFIVPPAT